MKESILVGAGLWFASLTLTREMSVAYIGIPLNLLVPCVVGTWCGISFMAKIEPRSRLFSVFLAGVFMGAAFSSIVNAALTHYLGLVMTDGFQAATATVVSFITPHALPWIVDVAKSGKWVDWIPFIRRGDKEK